MYLDVVMALNFLVDWLLLAAANRLAGHPAHWGKCALASIVGAVYAAVCLVWSLKGWQESVMHLVCLAAMAVIAYGVQPGALQRGGVFLLLSMALGGVSSVLQLRSFWGLSLAAGALCGAAALGFLRPAVGRILPVELRYGAKSLKLYALHDTGNHLQDPITGQSVLILGAKYARELTGLSQEQLRDPVQSMGVLPGLRLIPYRTVGQGGGFLLALKLDEVKIGTQKGSRLVAFATEDFRDGSYQALTGGMV